MPTPFSRTSIAKNHQFSQSPASAFFTFFLAAVDDDLRNQLMDDQKDERTIGYANGLIKNNLRGRINFFWSNHLVTALEVYDFLPFLYYYTDC